MKFRNLKASEIECRVGSVKDKGMSLLLYKTSRTDMDLLDETVGALNWKREHKELKGNIYCGISLYNPDINEWVTKWDAGSESYTEKEKGEASDSFKRAGVNWGIGRELYTSPFIWVTGYNKYERFTVREIRIVEGKIIDLVLTDSKGKIAFSTKGNVSKPSYEKKDTTQVKSTPVKETIEVLNDELCEICGGETVIKEGTSKAGKPYKMQKCKQCEDVKWL